MTETEERQLSKEVEQEAIQLIKTLRWYQVNKMPNKAGVLVEDILPMLQAFIKEIKIKG
jgi:hypothetical protein